MHSFVHCLSIGIQIFLSVTYHFKKIAKFSIDIAMLQKIRKLIYSRAILILPKNILSQVRCSWALKHETMHKIDYLQMANKEQSKNDIT